jgi:hypothetical protein
MSCLVWSQLNYFEIWPGWRQIYTILAPFSLGFRNSFVRVSHKAFAEGLDLTNKKTGIALFFRKFNLIPRAYAPSTIKTDFILSKQKMKNCLVKNLIFKITNLSFLHSSHNNSMFHETTLRACSMWSCACGIFVCIFLTFQNTSEIHFK